MPYIRNQLVQQPSGSGGTITSLNNIPPSGPMNSLMSSVAPGMIPHKTQIIP